jgi:hypothetical protein
MRLTEPEGAPPEPIALPALAAMGVPVDVPPGSA